jgi:hypothetical protein
VGFNVPVRIGEVDVRPGDLVLGDRDGMIVIPQAVAEEVIVKAKEVVHTENLVCKTILEGVLPLDAYCRAASDSLADRRGTIGFTFSSSVPARGLLLRNQGVTLCRI